MEVCFCYDSKGLFRLQNFLVVVFIIINKYLVAEEFSRCAAI